MILLKISDVTRIPRILAFCLCRLLYRSTNTIRAGSRGCFAAISNFILLLLVQVPTGSLARETLSILVRWVIILREQGVLFSDMRLGLLRLDESFEWVWKRVSVCRRM